MDREPPSARGGRLERRALAGHAGARRSHREGAQPPHAAAGPRIRRPLPLAPVALAHAAGERDRVRPREPRTPLRPVARRRYVLVLGVRSCAGSGERQDLADSHRLAARPRELALAPALARGARGRRSLGHPQRRSLTVTPPAPAPPGRPITGSGPRCGATPASRTRA